MMTPIDWVMMFAAMFVSMVNYAPIMVFGMIQ